MLEVDLEYPSEIHDQTQFFPLAAENRDIDHDMLTEIMKIHLGQLNKIRGDKEAMKMKTCHKLVGTCLDKKNYVVHFKILQFYLQKGLKISKMNYVIFLIHTGSHELMTCFHI